MKDLNRIKVVLVEQGRSGTWLAKQVGRDRSTVSRWCTNDIQPPLEVLFQIAEVLNVEVCELLVSNRRKERPAD